MLAKCYFPHIPLNLLIMIQNQIWSAANENNRDYSTSRLSGEMNRSSSPDELIVVRDFTAKTRPSEPLHELYDELNEKLHQARQQNEIQAVELEKLQLAVLRERREERLRLGRELHENLCQQLVGITFLAKVAAQNCLTAESVTRIKLNELISLLNQAIQTCQNLCNSRLLDPQEHD